MPRATAQAEPYEGRPVAAVQVEGLDQVDEGLVRNQLRLETGDPFTNSVAQQDVVRITHLGRFASVRARVTPLQDGSVELTYVVQEQPLLSDVRITGNQTHGRGALSDTKLLEAVVLRAGDPADAFLIERARQAILREYSRRGYFVADVQVDQAALAEGVLDFVVREGPRVRLRAVRFEGNDRFPDKQLRNEVQSKTKWLFIHDGNLSRERLDLDAAAVRDFYRDRGYLDAQVARRIDLAPNQRDATATFTIDEGPQYRVGEIEVRGADLFTTDQILLNMDLKRGDFYSVEKLRDSLNRLETLYGRLGYIETRVNIRRAFQPQRPIVDMVVQIEEGKPYTVGKVTVTGNDITKNHVVLRETRGLTPGRPFDREGIDLTERRLRESALFRDASVTVLGGPDDDVRDVLVETVPQPTGSLGFGVGVNSDSGLFAAIDIKQRNFDITDPPRSLNDLLTGKAFRGGGQYFAISLQPGVETSNYSVDWRDPYFLESDFFLDTSAFYYARERRKFDEQRIGLAVGLGKRFGDVWTGSIRARLDDVNISDIEGDAPLDVFAVEGDNLVTGLGLALVRSTTDSNILPTTGSRLRLAVEQVGLVGGDYDFTKLTAEYIKFWTIDEDFLGRRSVLSFRTETGYIPQSGEAPIFERFQAGGRGFRGFAFRGIGPRGIEADSGDLGDDAIGGGFLLLTSLQYEFPLLGNNLRGAIFTDQGTLNPEFSVDDWRVSVGFGVRFQLPIFSEAPVALDLAFPLLKEDTDEQRLFSFDLAVPF